MDKIAIVIINYFHDLAVALLACSILAVYLLGRWLKDHPERHELLGLALKRFSYLAYLALAYAIIGGAVRAYFFMDYEWNPAAGAGLVTALIVKHIILAILTIVGLIVLIRYSRKYADRR